MHSQAVGQTLRKLLKNNTLLYLAILVAGYLTFEAKITIAATLTSTVNVTIGTGGSIGATTPTETTTTVETTGDANGDGEITTSVGDAVTIQTSTFRALATPPQISATTTSTISSITTQSGPSTTSDQASDQSSSGAPSAAQRFNEGAQAASDYFGGASSVSVSGVPNQTYSITLPGETSFSTGSETIDIGGFAHDAGATPQLGSTGSGSFTVAAQVNDAGASEAGASEAGGGGEGTVAEVGSVQQILATPVVTRSPFVSIIVSYN